jgi:hypothetical protein
MGIDMMHWPVEPGSRALCATAGTKPRKTYDVNVSMARLRVEQQGNPAVGAWETRSDP